MGVTSLRAQWCQASGKVTAYANVSLVFCHDTAACSADVLDCIGSASKTLYDFGLR